MTTPSEDQLRPDVAPSSEAEPDFEQVLDADPAGAPLLNRLERLMIVIVFATTALTAVAMDLSISLGWFVGALVSFTSVAAVRRLARRIFAGGLGGFIAAVVLGGKLLAVLAIIWLVLTRLPASPIAFAGGHLAVVAGLVIGSVVMAPRPSRRVPISDASEAADDDGE